MSEEKPLVEPSQLSKWQQNKFLWMVGGSVVAALFLVGVALALYASSGAAQLDLSRPGYQSVRQQAAQDDSFDGFPATGTLDDKAIEQFRKLYDERAKQATGVDSFGGDVLSDKSLSIDAPGATPPSEGQH
ncbi:MAG TPA: hypothetical protein VFT59_02640 [Candidatus Saccharimonadales bacterium]|nr:hypothetical protein [Candidatus Saccharimonadales bacterium]